MGLQGGHGGQCGVEGLRQDGQVSREVRGRPQDCRSRASAFRDDRLCTYRGILNDDRSNQHQLVYSRALGDMQ
eukprot:10406377-Heterocapsa_arctica.AAC.1